MGADFISGFFVLLLMAVAYFLGTFDGGEKWKENYIDEQNKRADAQREAMDLRRKNGVLEDEIIKLQKAAAFAGRLNRVA